MSDESENYCAYLMRLWREETDPAWRASLEDAHSGQVWRFATLADLFDFLQRVTGATEGGTGFGE